jgi:hypothetical protein
MTDNSLYKRGQEPFFVPAFVFAHLAPDLGTCYNLDKRPDTHGAGQTQDLLAAHRST